jgi:hypothetical protein
VTPTIAKSDVRVQIVVLGREVEQIDDFIEKMEATGVFSRVMADEESVTKEGDIQVRLDAHYKATARAAGAPASVPETPAAKPATAASSAASPRGAS